MTALCEARAARETREDWLTARVVAMVAAVHSKHGRYEPMKYMANGKQLERERREREREREPISGDQIVARLRQFGVPIIDLRKGNS